MSNENQFVDEVLEVLNRITSAQARRMFGGHGLFHHERMFALIADNELYLKADTETEAQFIKADLERFQYQKSPGKVFSISYYKAPEDLFEDEETLQFWVQLAIDAANRAPAKKPRKKKKSSSS